MKIKDIIKKQTTIIAIAVILVTLTVIGISYAIFFDVRRNTNDQIITAGTLQLTVSGITALKVNAPMTESEGLTSSPITYTIENTASDLPAAYYLYIYAGSTNTIPLTAIKISIDGNATSGSTSTVLGNISETLNENSTTYYQIDSGNVPAGSSSSTQYLRIWVDESLLTDEIESGTLDLQLYVVSEVQE